MSDTTAGLLLIGFGAHAKRIYYPICRRDGAQFGFNLECVLELESKRPDVEHFLRGQNDAVTQVLCLPDDLARRNELPREALQPLDQLVRERHITGVILATDPLNHMQYARWAMQSGLSLLLDKPISTRENIATAPNVAKGLVEDYEELMSLYRNAPRHQGLPPLVSVMAQRRYHPMYRRAKELVAEVFTETNCPVTSIQSFHADGQWRPPVEILHLDYHPFNRGYGKCSHSGYHFFDLVPWILEAAESREKEIDNVDVFANFLRPSDFARQLTFIDYNRLFPDYCEYARHNNHELDDKEFGRIATQLGEIDAFTSLAFKSGDHTLTLGSINLTHNSFSQRGWLNCEGKDLYKGNGRLRHECHIIEQGPFQALSLLSFQSREVDPSNTSGLFDVGGEHHFELHVFRNTRMFPKWQPHLSLDLSNRIADRMTGKSRGHQEEAKREAVLEFVRHLRGDSVSPVSDLATHHRAVQLMSGAYESAVNRLLGENPVVNVGFKAGRGSDATHS